MKTGDIVIYFFDKEEANSFNNISQIAPAVANRVWSKDCINCSVLADCNGVFSKTYVPRATSLEDAANGYKFASVEQVEEWGVDLSNSNHNLDDLLKSQSEEKQPSDYVDQSKG